MGNNNNNNTSTSKITKIAKLTASFMIGGATAVATQNFLSSRISDEDVIMSVSVATGVAAGTTSEKFLVENEKLTDAVKAGVKTGAVTGGAVLVGLKAGKLACNYTTNTMAIGATSAACAGITHHLLKSTVSTK